MAHQNLSKTAKVTRVMTAVAAGVTDQESDTVDMSGFQAVEFLVAFGAITASAVTSVKLQTSSDDSTWNDLEGTAQTVADDDDDKVFVLDLYAPRERYIRCAVDRGTQNAVIDGIVALQYGAASIPVTHDSTSVGGTEFHAGVAEGTA